MFLFLQQYCSCIRPSKLTEAKFFDPSSTNIYCGLRLGPKPDQKGLGRENRATTVVISSNLNSPLKLFFYLPILTNNILLFIIYCENIVVVFFN